MAVILSMQNKLVPDKRVSEAFAGITAATALYKGFRVERPDANTLVVIRRYCPTWAIFLALVGLLLFLIGLLFLLVRTEDRLTIIAYDDPDGGARYTVAGRTDKRTADFLEGYLKPV